MSSFCAPETFKIKARDGIPGVLTIYSNNADGNLVHLTRWDNNPPQSISKSAEETKKSAKIDSPQITAHIF